MIRRVEIHYRAAMARANRFIDDAPSGGFTAGTWYFNRLLKNSVQAAQKDLRGEAREIGIWLIAYGI